MDIPRRKTIRLKDYDYSKSGKYFITICTKNREMLLGSVGTGVLDGPSAGIRLTDYGIIAEKYILQLNSFYSWKRTVEDAGPYTNTEFNRF